MPWVHSEECSEAAPRSKHRKTKEQESPKETATWPAQWDEEADIVIVGGGGAGGAAAYAGRKAGVDVLVLESQSSTTFSSTALSGDSICFVGTEEQAAAGIEDSAEAFMQECLELGEHANKEEVIQTYLDHNLEYYEILKEIGVQFEGVVMLDTYTPRTLNFSSAEHQQLLTEATQELGARYLFETSGKRLYVDAAGTVCGVEASKDGKTIAVKPARPFSCAPEASRATRRCSTSA